MGGRVFLIGVDHRAAPGDAREALAPAPERRAALLTGLGLPEAALLATCDRLELIGVAAAPDQARDAFARLTAGSTPNADAETSSPPIPPLLSWDDAARLRLARIAASLESQTPGEPQILGQVRAAEKDAAALGLLGPLLRDAFDLALRCARRVRAETTIAEGPSSIAAAAVQAARDLHGDLKDTATLLIGGGELGELVAERLIAAGVRRVAVAARAVAHAADAAQRLEGRVVKLDELDAELVKADVVICAQGGRAPLIDKLRVRAALRVRRFQPILFVDLAQPADVAADVAALEQAFLFTLDDLEMIALKGRAARAAALRAAEAIIAETMADRARIAQERAAGDAAGALTALFEAERRRALADAPDDADRATRLLIGRLAHGPLAALRQAAGGGEDPQALAALVRRLFSLTD